MKMRNIIFIIILSLMPLKNYYLIMIGLKKILSIILYSDATTLDQLGKSSEHPIYLSLGNISIWRRNKCDAKALLGFLPKLKLLHNYKNNKKGFASIKRILY